MTDITTCVCLTNIPLWAPLSAFEASVMTLRTSLLVVEFSRASLWFSILISVFCIPSACSSYLFLRFRASSATETSAGKCVIDVLWVM